MSEPLEVMVARCLMHMACEPQDESCAEEIAGSVRDRERAIVQRCIEAVEALYKEGEWERERQGALLDAMQRIRAALADVLKED